jgi:hypothetical protein
VGQYVNGERSGPEILTWVGGNKYVGQFKDNKYDGLVLYTTPTARFFNKDYGEITSLFKYKAHL